MLGSLKQSTEQRATVDEATKYLRGIRGDLVRRKKVQAIKNGGIGVTGLLTRSFEGTPTISPARGPQYPQLSSQNLAPNIPQPRKKYQIPHGSLNSVAPSSAGYRARDEKGR